MASAPEVLLDGIVFGESPRWHDGRLWFSDWGAGQVIVLNADGGHDIAATVASFPMCIDFLPDGRLLVVDSAQRRVLRQEPSGALAPHADLSGVSGKPWNEIVVDSQGNAYVNSIGFQFPGEPFAPGLIALVTPDGERAPGSRRPRLPQRHGHHRGRRHADRGRVVRQPAHRLRHRRQRRPEPPAHLGPDPRRPPRRDLPRRRRRRLVRRCRQQALCPGP